MKSALSVLLIAVTCWECIHSEKYGCADTDGTNLRQPGGNENGDIKLTFEGFSIKAESDLGAFDVRVHQQNGDAGQICYSHKGGKTEVAGDCATPIDGIYIQFHPKSSTHLSKVCEFNGVGGPKCPPGQRYVKGGVCIKDKQVHCKFTQHGLEYKGHLSVTISGKTCLNWSTYPNPKHLDRSNPTKYFPEKNLADAVNYCRNGDDTSQGPWCYIDNDSKWEACNIKFCTENDCKRTQNGLEYNGRLSVTTSGKKCLNWSTHPYPKHLDRSNPTKYFPEKNLADAVNYCRNGDDSSQGPWCYTNNDASWEACDVKFCARTDCKLTQRGTEYVGKLSVTYYGKKCLNWATHPTKSYLDPADPTKYFRETNLKDAVNYCRNGDGSRKGPWCYIDNAGYTEYCDIPYCPGAPAK